jgi:hypothetical protein
MTTSEIDLHALLERVQKLEVQNRHWRLASLITFVLLLASLTVGLAHGQQPQPNRPQTVEAQSFVLRDAGGTVRGQLSMKDNTPSLELYDKGGQVFWSTSQGARLLPAR